MLTVAQAAQHVGRSPGTIRRWIRSGRLPATTLDGRHAIDPADLDNVRDELYPTLEMPEDWQRFEDGTPVPNWVAAIALSRQGR